MQCLGSIYEVFCAVFGECFWSVFGVFVKYFVGEFVQCFDVLH